MDSKKCTAVIQVAGPFKNEKICNATQFFDSGSGEQCPKFCAHCGGVLNKGFDENREHIILRDDGPTIKEFAEEGGELDNYPPEGFKGKVYTTTEFKEALKIETEWTPESKKDKWLAVTK